MSWVSSLYDTYENYSQFVGIVDDGGTVLLPISHSTQNAQIEITIDTNGNFLRAEKVDKKDAVTIIPVTEDSCSRGNGVFPHPLNDKLFYIAGDYCKFQDESKLDKYFKKYILQLKNWSESLNSHEKVIAIYKYLKKEKVIKDLIDEKVLEIDNNGKLSNKIKIEDSKQSEAFIRFNVQKYDNNFISETWLDKTLYESYIKYYDSIKGDKDICYISGKYITCSEKHSSKIRNTRDMAKIISANDEGGFTYRGRFTQKSQAASVGYESSQKAHNALRWLIQKQGYTKDGAAIVAWSINGADVPSPLENTDDLFYEDMSGIPDTSKSYSDRLNRAISGYQADLNTTAKIVIIAVDAATTGRLSITFYRELNGSEFLEKIKNWHLICSWKHNYKKNEKRYEFIGAPSPREITLAAFGTEQNGQLKANDKLVRSTVERLLPCIVDSRRIPYDILNAAYQNAIRPLAMSYNNWQNVFTVSCAIIKKHRYEKYKEEWDMSLDKENQDRNYLFGRLLAVADRVEFLTYESGEKRETNAKRYMNVFSKRPAKTWNIIYQKLLPYLNKLKPGQKIKYDSYISEIGSMFKKNEFNNDQLNELFLLGYYCQLELMKSKKENISEEMEDEVNE